MALDVLTQIAHLQSEMSRAGLILANDAQVMRSDADKTRLGREFMALSPAFAKLAATVCQLLAALNTAQASASGSPLSEIEAAQARAAGIGH
ncbi:hypothetical protein ACJ4V0_15695 [Phreatobacter sp. HK31-P]